MIRYVPFLKAKQGERAAVGDLTPEVKRDICPFFDFPRAKPDYDLKTYAAVTSRIARGLKKHWGAGAEFYFDDFDIRQKLTVNTEQQYAHILRSLKGLQVIPVVGLDRANHHNPAVAQLKDSGDIVSDTVAFRAIQQDFEDFDTNEDHIDYDLATVFERFESIDLILDCQLCSGMNVSATGQQIAEFAQKFCDTYEKVRRVVVTGSSIPPSLSDVVKPKTAKVLTRAEVAILSRARSLSAIELVAGDYTTVGPFYSDVHFAPELLPRVTSPRLIYSFDASHYVARGSSLRSGGYGQYFGLTQQLCGQNFFRHGHSTGENYFYAKSKRIGGNATNATVVKPSVVAHISYMVRGAKL